VWWNATLASSEGRLDEAIAMAHRAGQLEPTIPMYLVAEGLLMMYTGQLPLAIETIRKGLEMDGTYPLGQAMLGQAFAESGQFDEAIPLLRSAAAQMAPGGYWSKGLLGHYLARQGDESGARQVLDELLTQQRSGYVQVVALAAIHAGLGEDDLALEGLEKAAQRPGAPWFWIPIDRLWARLHSHSRFQKILENWRRP
jgi:eukaryotic-like serine/threonine-protein kinase